MCYLAPITLNNLLFSYQIRTHGSVGHRSSHRDQCHMVDDGTSVTLIFYKIGEQWWKEPALNIVAAAAQMSAFTHVEIALGEDPGNGGQMTNVARVFNDAIGVVIAPQYVLPC